MYSYTRWKIFHEIVLYRDSRYDSKRNKSAILGSIKFIYSSKLFEGRVMWLRKQNICLCNLDFRICLIISRNQAGLVLVCKCICKCILSLLSLLKYFGYWYHCNINFLKKISAFLMPFVEGLKVTTTFWWSLSTHQRFQIHTTNSFGA